MRHLDAMQRRKKTLLSVEQSVLGVKHLLVQLGNNAARGIRQLVNGDASAQIDDKARNSIGYSSFPGFIQSRIAGYFFDAIAREIGSYGGGNEPGTGFPCF